MRKSYHFYNYHIFITGAHRALPDVLAMEEILTHPSLIRCLSSLSIRTPGKQVSQWIQQKRAHIRSTTLLKSLGRKCITPAQAKRLDSLGLGLQKLLELRNSHTKEGLLRCLKDKGVRSEAVRNKLQMALEQSR